MRPFRFAVQLGPFQDPDALRPYARRVEELGYEELYTADHIGGGAVDPFVPLLIAAEATTRLRVGPLVLNNEFHHPALLARTAASMDQMTGGRLILGMGTGYSQAEHDAIGLTLRPPPSRVGRFAESLEVLRQLLGTGTCSFSGEHHTVEIDDLGPRPVNTMPILIGGNGRRVVGLAGRYASIFQMTGLSFGPDGRPDSGGFPVEKLDIRVRWLADAAGERDGDIERSALVQLAALDDAVPSETEMVTRFRHGADVLAHTPFVLAGSFEQVVDKLERTRERLGISHYVIRDPEGFAPVVAALAGH